MSMYEQVKIKCIEIVEKTSGVSYPVEALDAIYLSHIHLDSLDMVDIFTQLDIYYDITLDKSKASEDLTLDSLASLVFEQVNTDRLNS